MPKPIFYAPRGPRRFRFDAGVTLGISAVLAVLALILAIVIAWVTHVVVCIKTAAWVLLVVGAFIFPIGIVHGFAVLFGIL